MQSNWSKLQSKVGKSKKRKRNEDDYSSVDGKFNSKRAFSLQTIGTGRLRVQSQEPLAKVEAEEIPGEKKKITEVLAMDCEFVGCGPGGRRSALARVSIVNFHGHAVYDKFVRPKERIVDYRTKFSGVRAKDLSGPDCVPFDQASKEVAALIKDKTIVGHSLKNDFSALLFPHPKHLIRDTAYDKYFCPFRPRSLKELSKEFLQRDIQSGEHCSVEDAKAAMDLYRIRRKQWETRVAQETRKNKKKQRDGQRKFM